MSDISYMTINEIEDRFEELEEINKDLMERVEKYENEENKYDDLCVVLENVAEALNINVRTSQFKFDPENEIIKAIEELQNAQTTEQA